MRQRIENRILITFEDLDLTNKRRILCELLETVV